MERTDVRLLSTSTVSCYYKFVISYAWYQVSGGCFSHCGRLRHLALSGAGKRGWRWDPKEGIEEPPPAQVQEGPFANRRRGGMFSLGGYVAVVGQVFFQSQFRNPLSPNNPNKFGLQVPIQPLEAGTAPGDSGGPVFAMINGQLTQIGVVARR